MAPGITEDRQPPSYSLEESQAWRPVQPNILVTGTPGVGKTTLSRQLAQDLGLRHIEVGAFARERNLLADHDAAHEAFYMHEDAVLDELEPNMANGSILLDHHSCNWYPERWIQMVVCLTASTEELYDRLEQRGYSSQKLNENMQAEIMQVVLEEATSSYPRARVLTLQNDTDEQMNTNIREIKNAWRLLLQTFQSRTRPPAVNVH